MGNTLRALQRAVAAGAKAAFGPNEYEAGGKQVLCTHCGNSTFNHEKALLNTAGRTLAGLDWTDKEATILVCSKCGRIEWFANTPDLK
jgi:predicted nucleic-acid-binding Zn-ribbon protein